MTEPVFSDFDRRMMERALELARSASAKGEVPVGAVIAFESKQQILSEASNRREELADPTAHAERLALTAAGAVVGRWRLDNATLYVTLEPCSMCAGAIVLARLARVVYAATDPKAGACDSLYRIASDPRLNHRATVVSGLLAEESGRLLSDFFRARRAPLRSRVED
jgi:tRNA(adenine34) deaminase